MLRGAYFLPFVFLFSFASPRTIRADAFPGYTVDAMCDKADLIVEATHLSQNEIQIDKVYKTSPLLRGDFRTMEVAQLQRHDKTIWNGFLTKGPVIETKRLVLFLVHDSQADQWESMATIDDGGQCGSCGLYWFDDSACYGYIQAMNPGPYVLARGEDSDPRIPKTIADMRASIRTGLANSREWRWALAIEDPSKRARALARYLFKSTSPKGDEGSYLYAARAPMAALGSNAVPVLIQILRSPPADEKLDEAVLVLYDIGPPSAKALPELRALLAQPERAYTGYVLSALGATGDPRAIPDLEKYLASSDKQIAKDAREALELLHKRQP
jgi:hypothetical protein